MIKQVIVLVGVAVSFSAFAKMERSSLGPDIRNNPEAVTAQRHNLGVSQRSSLGPDIRNNPEATAQRHSLGVSHSKQDESAKLEVKNQKNEQIEKINLNDK